MLKTCFVSTFALAAAMPAIAHAADDATAAGNDAIVVTATRSGDAVPAHLIGSSVTVIDSKALQDRQTRIVSDVLRDVPGVAVSRTDAVGGLTQIRIRGSEGNHVLVFIDGIKARDPYYGEYDFGNLIADDHARIEVLRGQQSSLYGSDAIGGVISYTTLSGREAPGYSLRAEGGSFGTFSTAGRVAGTVGDSADYALSASYLTTSGYPTAPGGDRKLGSDNLGLSGKVNWTPAPNFKVTAVGRYSYTQADLNNQDIAATSPLVQGYPVITAVDTPGNFYRNKVFYGLVRAELSLFDDAWTTALSAQMTDAARDAYTSSGYNYGDRGQRYRGSFENTVRFGTDRIRNRATFAVDAEREESRNVDPSGYAYTGRHRVDTLGFVAQYDVTIDDRLAIGGSLRIDSNSFFKDVVTGRVTGSYLLPTGTRIHAAYGTGVKAPTPGELFGYVAGQYVGNPDLRPEKSKGWEAGVEQELLDSRLKVGATYFFSRLEDEIIGAGSFFNDGYLATSINNSAIARQRGVETYANLRLGDWGVDASYTYLKAPQLIRALASQNDGTFHDAVTVETQAVRRPKNVASFNLNYTPEEQPFSATLTVRYNGRQRDYAFNSFYQRLLVDMKAYTLVNINAAYDITRNVQIYGRVENLLAEKYQEVFTYASPGRAAYGGVRVKF